MNIHEGKGSRNCKLLIVFLQTITIFQTAASLATSYRRFVSFNSLVLISPIFFVLKTSPASYVCSIRLEANKYYEPVVL